MNELINIQKLKPCPFCGGEVFLDTDGDWYWKWKVECQGCGCDLGYYETEAEATEAWNKRVEPPADQWSPCSSGRLPKHKQQAFITVKLTESRRYVTTANYYTETGIVDECEWADEGFYTYDSEYGYYRHEDVIAWMPLPEPYKGE